MRNEENEIGFYFAIRLLGDLLKGRFNFLLLSKSLCFPFLTVFIQSSAFFLYRILSMYVKGFEDMLS